jgi:arylformamidase
VRSDLIDISMPVSDRLPAWPESPGASLRFLQTLAEGAEADVSELRMDVHTGTHVDAPAHMIAGAATMDAYDLAAGVGEAVVVDTGDAEEIDADVLASLELPADTRRLLLRTRNSARPELREPPFATDYSALAPNGSEWLVERGIELVGIDYLSIQRFGDPLETHLILFRGGVTILEGLWLADVDPGRYELMCLPLRLAGREAAPARAVLRRLDG